MMKNEMLTKMTVKELRTYAKENELKIAKLYELKKDELIAAIADAEIAKFEKENVAEIVELEEKVLDTEIVPEKKDSKKNGWEKIATKQLTNAYNMYVGGLENTLQDYSEEDEEYQNAYEILCSDPEDLVEEIYHDALLCEYGVGFSGAPGSAPKEMKFAGKEFCKGIILDLIKKDGFCGFSDEYPTAKQCQEILDEVVAETSVNPRTKFSPIIKIGKYANSKAKYQCPDCGNIMGNPDEYCGKCGLHLYHGDDERYSDAVRLRENVPTSATPADAILITKYGKTHKYCPICNSRVDWEKDWHFCYSCGQEVK